MRTYLLDHIGRYPKMQIPDAVKLLYQSEFGSGHMIADPGKSLERIRKEWNEVREMKNAEADCAKKTSCVIEEIGDGMCGSGKTTLGTVLAEVYDCNLFHMDDFLLRPEQRVPERLAEPGGNVDYERFQEEVLDHLKAPEGLSYRVYDCSVRRLTETVTVPYSRLNIIEGAYSQNPYFHDPYDLRFLCSISEEEQKARILRRNGPEMLKKFQEIWIPMENRYFETFRLRDKNIVLEL